MTSNNPNWEGGGYYRQLQEVNQDATRAAASSTEGEPIPPLSIPPPPPGSCCDVAARGTIPPPNETCCDVADREEQSRDHDHAAEHSSNWPLGHPEDGGNSSGAFPPQPPQPQQIQQQQQHQQHQQQWAPMQSSQAQQQQQHAPPPTGVPSSASGQFSSFAPAGGERRGNPPPSNTNTSSSNSLAALTQEAVNALLTEPVLGCISQNCAKILADPLTGCSGVTCPENIAENAVATAGTTAAPSGASKKSREDDVSAVDHFHGPRCGHIAILHEKHVGFLVDGRVDWMSICDQQHAASNEEGLHLTTQCGSEAKDVQCLAILSVPKESFHTHRGIPCGDHDHSRSHGHAHSHHVHSHDDNNNSDTPGECVHEKCEHLCIQHGNHNNYYLSTEDNKLVLHHVEQQKKGKCVCLPPPEKCTSTCLETTVRIIRQGELKKENRVCQNGEVWQKLFRLKREGTDGKETATPSSTVSLDDANAPPKLLMLHQSGVVQPTPSLLANTGVAALDFDYSTRWNSRTEAVAAVKQFALSHNKMVVLDPTVKSGTYIVLRCSSAVKSNGKCPFFVKLCKTRKKGDRDSWHVVKCGLHLVHDNCQETVEPSTSQLTHLPSFLQAVQADRNVSAKKLTEILKASNGMVVNKRKLYRAKEMVVNLMDEEFKKDFHRLDSWFEKFVMLNSGSLAGASWEANAFQSLHIVPKPMVVVAQTCAQRYVQIRTKSLEFPLMACVAIVAEIVDSNLTCVPLAFGMYPDNSEDSYCAFFRHLKTAGLEAWMNSDQMTLLTAFDANLRHSVLKELPNVRHRWCFADLVQRMKTGVLPNTNFGEKDAAVWGPQMAETHAAHQIAMNQLEVSNPEASAFLRTIAGGIDSWAQYASLERDRKTYGHVALIPHTSALFTAVCEINTSRFSLITLLDGVGRAFMVVVNQGRELGRHWTESGQVLTKAITILPTELAFIAAHYTASASDDDVCFVTCPSPAATTSSFVLSAALAINCSRFQDGQAPSKRQYRVDLLQKTCSCKQWQQFGYPCKHARMWIETKQMEESVRKTFGTDPIYYAGQYYAGYNCKIETPLLETLEARDNRAPPPEKVKEKNDKKKKRKISPSEDLASKS